MDERARAEEHLRVIRSLMERATVYRAISAPTALVGGLSSLAIAGWMLWRIGFFRSPEPDVPLNARDFITPWLGALLLTGVANTFFIWREAQRGARPFWSPGLRLALSSLLPAVLVAAAITFALWRNPNDLNGPVILALTWISFYGIALLGTSSFAPHSLSVLAWCFVITPIIWLLLLSAPTLPELPFLNGIYGANLAMGLTFGLYHVVYALATWSNQARTRAAE